MVAEAVVVICRMTNEAVLDVIVPDIAPYDGHLAHIHYFEEIFLLSCRLGHTESRRNVSLQAQALGNAVGGYSKTTIYLGRELPSEH